LSIPRLWGKNVKTFRWDQRLQIQNLFMLVGTVGPIGRVLEELAPHGHAQGDH
ncbi:unnamed protein product, partial [Ascophyllum nodosum]